MVTFTMTLATFVAAAAAAAVGAVTAPSCPAGNSGYEQDTDFKGDDLRVPVPNITSAPQCCAVCTDTVGCNAISFGPLPTFGCRLKKGVTPTGRQHFKGRLSFLLRPPPPPPPPSPPVVEIHLVASNHFDAGCKIRGCQPDPPAGYEDPIWPAVCATTMHGPAQPHAYHVLNRYFTNYFPRAAALGDAARASNKTYRWMTQPWVVDLFMHCDEAHYYADPRYTGGKQGISLLQCPNATQLAQFTRAVKLGDIFWHAAATDQEAGYFPSAGLFEASLRLNERLAEELGVPASTVVSTRDVPGWTRAALPLLARHNITGMSFGSGTPPGRPNGFPALFLWRDIQSGAEVVVTSESGYGGWGQLFVLPNGVGLAADWTGDNSGPAEIESGLEKLREEFPGAHVHSSTFSAFFEEANKPANKAGLPLVTAEMGDAWIYGVPSDPLKNAQFRELARARDECIEVGACDPDSAAMRSFDRLLVKIPEHTWGLAQSWFTADYYNYTNTQFHKALASGLQEGPLSDQSVPGQTGVAGFRADYYTTVQAWVEQRSYIPNAIAAIAANGAADAVPAGWATELAKRVAALSVVVIPTASGLKAAGYVQIQIPTGVDSTAGNSTGPGATVLRCGDTGLQVGFDSRGSITKLQRGAGSARSAGKDWASPTRPIGQFLYQTFNDDDYQRFLSGPGGFGINCPRGSEANIGLCGNFNRANMTHANPQHREASPVTKSLWIRNSTEAGSSRGCMVAVEGAMDPVLHIDAGAPAIVWSMFAIEADGIEADGIGADGIEADEKRGGIAGGFEPRGIVLELEVRMFNKTATRLPESIFVVFQPAVEPAPVPGKGCGWRLEMFNDSAITLDPTDVMVNGTGSGGAPHTRCISGVTYSGGAGEADADGAADGSDGSFTLRSADVPCVSTGSPNPFPTPRDEPPDMAGGVSYNVLNNIWSTNYVLWYPFVEQDKDLKSRFSMRLQG
jgi:hypothetical protein